MKDVYHNLTVCIDEATAYPIHLQEGYDALPVLLQQFSLKNRRICIVSNPRPAAPTPQGAQTQQTATTRLLQSLA